ncbi:Uncharacterised protein [Mycobacteroides abscessus subsp. abscessus]|nr:Uncharacterised protein [Mycobacteroides abscessus subsp. abscessus]
MPMRHPNGINTPACSPASSRVVAPSTSAVCPVRPKVTVPPCAPTAPRSSANRSMCRRSEASASTNAASTISKKPPGPHAHVSRDRQSGLSSSSDCAVTLPSALVYCTCRSMSPLSSISTSSSANSRSSGVGAECTTRTSVDWPRCRIMRSIEMIGVRPLPAVRKSTLSGSGSGRTNSPWGAANRTTVPGSSPLTRCVDRKPSGIALTVIAMVPSVRVRSGTDVSEYERHVQRPSTRTPIPMYCPGA